MVTKNIFKKAFCKNDGLRNKSFLRSNTALESQIKKPSDLRL